MKGSILFGMRLQFCQKPLELLRVTCFSSCLCVWGKVEQSSMHRERAWATRLERKDLGFLAVRAATVQRADIIPQLSIVPLTWSLLQTGVLCSVCPRERWEREREEGGGGSRSLAPLCL